MSLCQLFLTVDTLLLNRNSRLFFYLLNLSVMSLTELPIVCTFLVPSGFWVTLCVLFKVNCFGIIPEGFRDVVEAFANNGVFYIEREY